MIPLVDSEKIRIKHWNIGPTINGRNKSPLWMNYEASPPPYIEELCFQVPSWNPKSFVVIEGFGDHFYDCKRRYITPNSKCTCNLIIFSWHCFQRAVDRWVMLVWSMGFFFPYSLLAVPKLEFSLHSSWIHMLIRLGPQYVLSKSIIECQVNGKCLKFNFNLQWFAIINPRGLETDPAPTNASSIGNPVWLNSGWSTTDQGSTLATYLVNSSTPSPLTIGI